MLFRTSGSNEGRTDSEGPETSIGWRVISSIVSDDLEDGLSWILFDPRVTSRGGSSQPECLTLSTSLLPEFGATNEIKTLASPPSLSEYMLSIPASEKIYVEGESDLISFANVFKSLDLINRRLWGMAGIVSDSSSGDIEVTHGKSHRMSKRVSIATPELRR